MRERTSYIGCRKAKAKEKPKRTWDSAQSKSKDRALKSYACAGCRQGCLQVCSTEALRELKRAGTVQAGGKRL
jgi:ribosomal protein L28